MKYLSIIFILLTGCSSLVSDKNLHGVYQKEFTLIIRDSCEMVGYRDLPGWYIRKGKKATICLATKDYTNLDVVWAHEAKHLFLDMVGLPQPKEKKLRLY